MVLVKVSTSSEPVQFSENLVNSWGVPVLVVPGLVVPLLVVPVLVVPVLVVLVLVVPC